MKYCRIVHSGEPYLAHHGIDGQKWGIRNGPPYPLDRETHTEVVREGYKRDRELLKKGKLSQIKTSGSKHFIEHKLDYQWTEVIKASNLSDNKHNVAYWMQDPAQSHAFKMKTEEEKTWDSIAKNVNYGFGEAGTTNNCMKCTAAVEMQKRGWRTLAGRSFNGGQNQAMSYWFDGATQYKEKGIDAAAERLEKTFGNNGRGELTFRYPDGGGHSVYCFRDKDGCHILDGQSGERFDGKDWRNLLGGTYTIYGFDKDGSFASTRLDTATPNLSHMEEDSVLRMDYTDHSMNQMYNNKTESYGVMFDQRTDANIPVNNRQYTRDAHNKYFNEDIRDGSYGYRVSKQPWDQGSSLLKFKKTW